jgi:hypothetical protein
MSEAGLACPDCGGDRCDPTYDGYPWEDGGPDKCPTCNGTGEVIYLNPAEHHARALLQTDVPRNVAPEQECSVLPDSAAPTEETS